MIWWEWVLTVAGLVAIFVTWDFVFCGGRRCKRVTDQLAPGERGETR